MNESVKLQGSNVHQIELLVQEKVYIWYEHVLFSGLWWLGVMLLIVPWVIWFWIRNKNSTDRILYSGFFVMIISLVLDVLGDQLGLWHYRFNVIPLLPTYFPWDITLMPVAVMLLIQVKPEASPVMKAIFFALLTSYVGEPLFKWLMIYNPEQWRYSYSVPIQFIIYLIAHKLSGRNKFQELA